MRYFVYLGKQVVTVMALLLLSIVVNLVTASKGGECYSSLEQELMTLWQMHFLMEVFLVHLQLFMQHMRYNKFRSSLRKSRKLTQHVVCSSLKDHGIDGA